jgi:hypothetical protein
MIRRLAIALVAIPLVVALSLSCGPDETPEQKLARLRDAHEIIPVGYTTITDPDGTPRMVVDLQVTNQGGEPLDQLTVLVRVTGADGVERLAEHVTLDLEGLRPGIGERRSAVIPGFAGSDADEVLVEIEAGLSPDELQELPEWDEVTSAG